MQEIADEADINKSMLHYYFRSKDQLFQEVYQGEMARFLPTILEVAEKELPIDKKVEQLVDTYHSFFKENPELPQFVIMEMNTNPERFKKFISEQGINLDMAKKQMVKSVENDNIDANSIDQLIVAK